MAVRMTREVLKEEIDALPEALAEEVLDFVRFMKARRAEETFLWRQVEDTRAYRRQHPEEVITVTAEEWETATAGLDGDR